VQNDACRAGEFVNALTVYTHRDDDPAQAIIDRILERGLPGASSGACM
jgi:hypothetical protein